MEVQITVFKNDKTDIKSFVGMQLWDNNLAGRGSDGKTTDYHFTKVSEAQIVELVGKSKGTNLTVKFYDPDMKYQLAE